MFATTFYTDYELTCKNSSNSIILIRYDFNNVELYNPSRRGMNVIRLIHLNGSGTAFDAPVRCDDLLDCPALP
ncbi:16094_t:CDS:1, partial [Funneliformis geosporum]